MATRVDEGRQLVEGLLASAQARVDEEAERVARADEEAGSRATAFVERRAAVSEFLDELSATRVQQAGEDGQARAAVEAARVQQANADGQVRAADVAQRHADVAQTLGELSATRLQQAEADGQARAAEVDQMRADAGAAVRANASERAEVAGLWREAMAALRAMRGGTAPPDPKKQAPKGRVAAVKTEAPSGAQQGPSRDEIFGFIADHPDGVTLVQMEEHFEVARIVLTREIKELCESDSVRKDEEDKRYFAV